MRVRPLLIAAAASATAVSAITVPGASAAVLGRAGPASSAASTVVVHAAPDGSGTGCAAAQPCGLTGAQQHVRNVLATSAGASENITVEVADGTYRLGAPLRFGPADSGRNGHQVTWTAAPGAHPVISGALRVTGWHLSDKANNVWSAPVPPSLDTRQIYINGAEAPIAQTTPAEQQVAFAAAPGGYTTTPDWGAALQNQIGAAAMSRVEFVYTGGNGPWTQSRCRIGSVSGATLVMQQPCWANTISRPKFTQASGGLPSMHAGTAPTLIENAYPFLHPGQWFLDRDRHVLDYIPEPGQDVRVLDVEAPRLTSLVTGDGTLDQPVHDITFSGLRFTGATWTDPSGDAGFADVQDNLRLTGTDPNNPQGTCTFGTPPGTCPFGSLTREPGNIDWSAARDITFEGNTFTGLGAAGLVFEYGSQHNTVEGNIFSGIAGGGIILGNTTDPHPSDVGADNREINAYNTIDNNLIENIGTDYPSAAAVTLFFTQHTQVVHNDIRDVPYTGISAGVIQGHVDNASHPDNTTNVNSDNTISDNLIHGFMQKLKDGGAIYAEGHQGQTILNADGTVDRAASIAHGLHAAGNVAFDEGNVNYSWYDDAGAEWIHWDGDVQWGGKIAQGGCETTGHFDVTGLYSAQAVGQYHCTPAGGTDVNYAGNTTLPAAPTAADLPAGTLASAGLQGDFRRLATGRAPELTYAQNSGTSVFLAGDGFTPGMSVTVDGVPATGVTVTSPGFAVATAATAPDPAKPASVTASTPHGTATNAIPPYDWAATGSGAQLVSFDGPDYTLYGCGPKQALDNNLTTGWGSTTGDNAGDPTNAFVPKSLVVKLPRTVNVASFQVDPSSTCGDDPSSSVGDYTIETSPDGSTWTQAASGTFTSANDGRLNAVTPAGGASGVAYVRFTILGNQTPSFATTCPSGAYTGCSYTDMTELALYGTPAN